VGAKARIVGTASGSDWSRFGASPHKEVKHVTPVRGGAATFFRPPHTTPSARRRASYRLRFLSPRDAAPTREGYGCGSHLWRRFLPITTAANRHGATPSTTRGGSPKVVKASPRFLLISPASPERNSGCPLDPTRGSSLASGLPHHPPPSGRGRASYSASHRLRHGSSRRGTRLLQKRLFLIGTRTSLLSLNDLHHPPVVGAGSCSRSPGRGEMRLPRG